MSKVFGVFSIFFGLSVFSTEAISGNTVEIDKDRILFNGKQIALGENSKVQLIEVLGKESHYISDPIWVDKGISAIDYYLDKTCIQELTFHLGSQLIAVDVKNGTFQYEDSDGFIGSLNVGSKMINRDTTLEDIEDIGVPIKNMIFPTFEIEKKGGRRVKFWFKESPIKGRHLHQVTISKLPGEQCQIILDERN